MIMYDVGQVALPPASSRLKSSHIPPLTLQQRATRLAVHVGPFFGGDALTTSLHEVEAAELRSDSSWFVLSIRITSDTW